MRERLDSEREFFDRQYAEDTRSGFARFYAISAHTYASHVDELASQASGKRVLEYGCGARPDLGIALARAGADVQAMDLSPVAVEQAREVASKHGVRIDCHVMDGENLEFDDDSFDIVCGHGIVHHLNLSSAFAEISRVLKPDGLASFVEPWGHNPLINMYRNRTPEYRTRDEHPLVRHDLELARTHFGGVDVSYYDCATLFAIPLAMTKKFGYGSRLFDRAVSALDRADRFFFSRSQRATNMAWLVRLKLTRPALAHR